jgi:hypothetical protein
MGCGVIPGKNGASAIPKQNLTATRPPKLVVPAVAAEMHDHMQTQKGMYSDGPDFGQDHVARNLHEDIASDGSVVGSVIGYLDR